MSRKGSFLAAGVSLAAVFALSITPALASVIYTGTYTGNGPTDTASAQFSISGSTLTIVLTNTSTLSAYHNGDALSAVFFDIQGSAQPLYGSSAVASGIMGWSGSAASYTAGPTNVSNQWGWDYNATGYTGAVSTAARYYIGAAGFSGLHPHVGHSNFNGTNTSLDGPPGSVVGSAFTSIGGDPGATFADNSVTFTFTGLGSGIADSDISNVTFGYGTNPDGSAGGTTGNGGGPGLPVPEPASAAILALGLAGILLVRRRMGSSQG